MMTLSTPSLGITRLTPLFERGEEVPFNSLSRDHTVGPASHSPPDIKDGRLSTPSLGITAGSIRDRYKYEYGELSTPSLGITRCRYPGALKVYLYLTFNSLSRDHFS